MNKAQLVDAIAAKADLSKAQAKVALEEIINGITPVSYTHLDVYKRQPQRSQISSCIG